MNIWKPIDAMGEWLLRELEGRVQLRIGVLLTLFSLPFYPYMIWSGEPPVIYFLSVLAATFGGLGLVISAQAVVHLEDQKSGEDSIK
ncbi:MAG TPA: hypothetical protein VIY48_05430 [Candidatus Paceibacterota bacterium]